MNKRPRSITVIGWLFIAVGCIGLVRGLRPLLGAAASRPTPDIKAEPPADFVLVLVSSLLAGTGGVFMLYSFNWARWLCVAWMGLHVILSILHSPVELLVHGLLFAALLYFLFRPQASTYFRDTTRPT